MADIDRTQGQQVPVTTITKFRDMGDGTHAETLYIGDGFVRDMALEIARGNVPGLTKVNKFGRNADVDTGVEDIWDGGGTWVAPTQARIHAIVSTSDEDSDTGGVVAQGDGARTIRLYGLSSWNTAETSEDITMDGTTSANTVNSYVIIHRMKVLTKGGHATGPNVGIITATAAVDATVTAQINSTEGQTQMAIYGIPSTQTAYLTGYYASANKGTPAAGTANIALKVNPEPDAELTNFLVKHTLGLGTAGTSVILPSSKFNPYYTIDGPAIIKMEVDVDGDNFDMSAGFDAIIVDN